MCTCNFFFEYIWIFFFFFFVLFFCLFSLKRKSAGPQRERRSLVLGEERGTRRSEQTSVGRKRRDGVQSIFLSSPALARSLGVMRLCHGSVMRKIPPACLVSGR